MPNWCSNELRINGSKEDVQRFREGLKQDKDSYLLLESLVPMPAILNGTISGTPNDEKAIALGYESSDAWRKACKDATGHEDWYGWQLANWGCKWGDCRTELNDEGDEESLFFTFETPWGPPEEGLSAIRELWPTLDFSLFYREDGMQVAGYL